MSSDIAVDLRFSTPIYSTRLEDFSRHASGLCEYVEQLRGTSAGVKSSNHAGWHSEPWLHVQSQHPDLKWLVEGVRLKAAESLKKSTGGRKGEIRVHNFWANVNESGAWNVPHDHAGAEWSGVVYVAGGTSADDEGEGDGATLFINPMPLAAQFGQPRTISYRVEPGLMLMFPGYLVHMVTPCTSSGPRITFSFNIDRAEPDPRGSVGREQATIPPEKMQSRVKIVS